MEDTRGFVDTIIDPTVHNDSILWGAQLERDEELYIEARYFDGSIRRGLVRYLGPTLSPLRGINSNEFLIIPKFETIGYDNPLMEGDARTFRILR